MENSSDDSGKETWEMTQRWQIEVELTFNPITIGDNPELSWQARERIHKVLSRMLEKEVEVSHYHLLTEPKYCVEFD